MPAVYTAEWYESVKDAINEGVRRIAELPDGAWTIAVEISGDGRSPYVGEGATKRFLIRLEEGLCAWYRQLDDGEHEGDIDYRFRGPATAFDEVAAGLLDPIDAALSGAIDVRGDIRFLLRQAELVQVLLEAYARGVSTDWPLGRPPYGNGSAA